MINTFHYKVNGTAADLDRITVEHADSYSLGTNKKASGWEFLYACDSDTIGLLIFKAKDCLDALSEGRRPEPLYGIYADSTFKTGEVFSLAVKGVSLDGLVYCYDDNNEWKADIYAKRVLKVLGADGAAMYFAGLTESSYDWEGDAPLKIPAEELIMYKLHVKGFTKNRFSKVDNKGTFCGLAAKIPYLRELGINGVELMPAYEFVNTGINPNYWGYDSGFYMAPCSSYCASYGKRGDYANEFKDMVREFHKNGIEVYMEMFFPNDIGAGFIDDCVRYWKKEYHIDGVHLICDERVRMVLAKDVFLKDMKLFYADWYRDGRSGNLFEYNNGYLESARRIIKGDEDQLQSFLYMMRKHPKHAATVNYVASNDGFTLADLYSYDRKHNEANGENNKDGADYNLSWNCGVEGPTKKRKVNELRMLLMKNAVTLLLTAQGVPMIYAGDEFGNSQGGNNNAYCQDNDTGWVDWSALNRNRRFYEFVKEMIAFRKAHGSLHMSEEPYLTDYRYYGLPDMSYHGSKAWYPELEHYNRQAGIMICGKYADEEENIYIAFNMHWEPHELALPNVAGRRWKPVITTGTEPLAEEAVVNESRMIDVPPRTVIILVDEKI